VAFRERCAEVFATRLEGANVIMATENRDLLERYCDCGAVLWNGQIEFFPSIEEAWGVHEELKRRMPARSR
jgi:capsular polysaccharide transport system ATP-binding protein